MELWRLIDLTEPRFCVAVIAIIFNPFFWNVVARWEHRTRGLTRLFGGPYVACYSLAVLILLLNVYRSHSITVAMKGHPRWEPLDNAHVYYTGAALMALGSVFVISSFMALGVTGTFLGDYFGILMDQKVTGFPFNVMENPMYWGSTANYLGLALMNASPIGVILTAVVGLSYKVAIAYEGLSTSFVSSVTKALFSALFEASVCLRRVSGTGWYATQLLRFTICVCAHLLVFADRSLRRSTGGGASAASTSKDAQIPDPR